MKPVTRRVYNTILKKKSHKVPQLGFATKTMQLKKTVLKPVTKKIKELRMEKKMGLGASD